MLPTVVEKFGTRNSGSPGLTDPVGYKKNSIQFSIKNKKELFSRSEANLLIQRENNPELCHTENTRGRNKQQL